MRGEVAAFALHISGFLRRVASYSPYTPPCAAYPNSAEGLELGIASFPIHLPQGFKSLTWSAIITADTCNYGNDRDVMMIVLMLA